jgi:hypothetical protein
MQILRSALLLVALVVSGASTPPSVVAAQSQKQSSETATQYYLRWRATALNATSMADITPFWTADMIEQFNMEPEPAKAQTLTMIKRFYGGQTDVKVVKETATPTGATLSLEAVDQDKKPVASSVDVVKENGAWKMTGAVERWTPKTNE